MVKTVERHFEDQRDSYIESPIIMTTVRFLVPFTFVYGFFLTFHGANAPGGAFQGGTVVGATVLMIAFTFGIAHTQKWVKNYVVTGLMSFGGIFLGLLGFSGILMGGHFLDHRIFYALGLEKGIKWGVEALEVGGIFFIVSGTIIGLFFVIAAGLGEDDNK